MPEQQQPQPRNIFECINLNIVDLSQDLVATRQELTTLHAKIDAIYNALYPPIIAQESKTEPKASGTTETK